MKKDGLYPEHKKLIEDAEKNQKATEKLRKEMNKFHLLLIKQTKDFIKDEERKLDKKSVKKYRESEEYKRIMKSLNQSEKICKEALK